MISFKVDAMDGSLIHECASRAAEMARSARIDYDYRTAMMDLTAVHANGTPLRLAALRSAPDTDFGHDVFGIRRYLDRETGQLMECFVPRCASALPEGAAFAKEAGSHEQG